MKKLSKCWLIIFLFFICFNTFSQQSVFINYSLEDGIPQSTVLSLFQDQNRNLWIGTQGGICKYNGQSFETFDTRHGLTDNHIASIFQDSKGRYWFGHRYKGVTLMQGKEFSKIHFTNSRINTIKEDLSGNIWFGTLDSALFVLPQGKDEIVENFETIRASDFPTIKNIYDLIVVDSNEIWLATENGSLSLHYSFKNKFTYKLSSIKNEFLATSVFYSMLKISEGNYWFLGDDILVNIQHDDDDFQIYQHPFDRKVNLDYLRNITSDKTGAIWGAIDHGVFKFENGIFKYITESEGLDDPQINTILSDVEGNLWIGGTNSGVYKYSGDKFKIINKESGLLDEIVTSVMEDSRKNVWIGTQKGLYIFDGKSVFRFKLPYGYSNIEISSIFEDSKRNIWIGSYGDHDLIRFNPHTGNFRMFNKSNGMKTTSVLTMCEDKNGCIWFATLGIGLSKYTYPNAGYPEKFEKYDKKDGLASVYIWAIHRDDEGNLWFGSDDAGLTKYDGFRFEIFNAENGLNNMSVGAITHDRKKQIWIASIGGGIYKFDGNQFVNYNIEHGLNSDNPYSIICDDLGMLWIGTNSGIDRFDPEKETFKNYDKEEGFLGIENNQNAVFKGKDGNLWFGTVNGLVKFDPKALKPNLLAPSTAIENIRLFYSEFDHTKFADSIDAINKLPTHLTLQHNKNHLTFDFCGVSLSVPGKVSYKYKLENFDLDWNPVTQSTVATYTNIPPGEYVFKVIACNNDGIWNDEPTQLSVVILAPFWQKWWFITLVIILVIGLIYLIFYLRIKTIKTQRAKLLSLVEEKTRELLSEVDERKKATIKAEQSDRLKTAFLANMSHEIRTPVNAITGFTELLYDKDLSKEEREVYMEYIKSGGKALLTLIDDIIDISKIEAGQLVIRHDECSVNSLMSDLFKLFQQIKQKKDKNDIDLRIPEDVIKRELVIKTDANRLKQILSNLIGNAIKFTHEGFIEFGYTIENQGQIVFYVKDTGIGIDQDKQDIIFQRFRQVEESFTKNYEGTGLGLAISKKLTNLLGGKMWVESKLKKGSAFYFSIPLEIVKIDEEINVIHDKPAESKKIESKNILVVEDEDSNYILTETILKALDVNVFRAEDGIKAVDMIRRNGRTIDLILMDIKMPGMNGFEATAEIKKIKSEIPIIAQTAYTLAEEKEKCLAVGCDDYIAKPIDRKLLLEKINKFLDK